MSLPCHDFVQFCYSESVGRNFVRCLWVMKEVILLVVCGYCAIVTKSWNLNFLDSFGPVQACNGTDVPLPFYFWVSVSW